ncbi:MAG: flagellar filament capping protein FliD [Planctomycetota bacterium]
MSGISTGVGVFSGIDTQSLIEQLLAVEARPRDLAQQRIAQIQFQQAGFLNINSRLSALASSARAFRTDNIFNTKEAVSSNEDIIRASAGVNATTGTFNFVVDRLVSSQQQLSSGFVSRSQTGIGEGSFTFEPDRARLDRDTELARLNNGDGITRGELNITQGSTTATIDLTRATRLSDVIDAINSEAGLDITASANDGRLVLTSNSSTDFTVADSFGTNGTAESLGIEGSSTGGTLNGADVFGFNELTVLSNLNDGSGVFIGNDFGIGRFDFTIVIDDDTTPDEDAETGAAQTAVRVNLGQVFEEQGVEGGEEGETEVVAIEEPVRTVQGVLDRINDALSNAGVTGVTAAVNNGRLEITADGGRSITVQDKEGISTTAADLGLTQAGTTTGTLTAERTLAGLNTTLLASLNGGSGIDSTDTLDITDRAGNTYNIDLSSANTVQDVVSTISAATGGVITASLNDAGNGLNITDNTAAGSITGDLVIAGTTAASLGIETTGVSASSFRGTNLQLAYVTAGTRLSDFNGGQDIGTGTIRFVDGSGLGRTVEISNDAETLFDVIDEINKVTSAAGLNIEAAINDNGDGIVIREADTDNAGSQAIVVEDVTGNIADTLGIAGTAAGSGADNVIDGSFEKTVTFTNADTLEDIVQRINDADAGTAVTIINDGTPARPFRLSFVSDNAGTAGRVLIDDNGFGLGLSTLDEGQDSLVFFGSSDPATGIALTSSTNTLDSVISGVSIDLRQVSSEPVSVTINRDNTAIEEAISNFITNYNGVLDAIDQQTAFNEETGERGALLGDSTTNLLRQRVSAAGVSSALNVSGTFQRFPDVGINIGEGGRLSLDSTRFREALEQDFDAVRDMLTARTQEPIETEREVLPGVSGITANVPFEDDQFSSLGLIFQIEELADNYIDSIDGVLTLRDDTLNDQIEAQQLRIDQLNLRLDQRRGVLEADFLAMEQALLQLTTQQNALSTIG